MGKRMPTSLRKWPGRPTIPSNAAKHEYGKQTYPCLSRWHLPAVTSPGGTTPLPAPQLILFPYYSSRTNFPLRAAAKPPHVAGCSRRRIARVHNILSNPQFQSIFKRQPLGRFPPTVIIQRKAGNSVPSVSDGFDMCGQPAGSVFAVHAFASQRALSGCVHSPYHTSTTNSLFQASFSTKLYSVSHLLSEYPSIFNSAPTIPSNLNLPLVLILN